MLLFASTKGSLHADVVSLRLILSLGSEDSTLAVISIRAQSIVPFFGCERGRFTPCSYAIDSSTVNVCLGSGSTCFDDAILDVCTVLDVELGLPAAPSNPSHLPRTLAVMYTRHVVSIVAPHCVPGSLGCSYWHRCAMCKLSGIGLTGCSRLRHGVRLHRHRQSEAAKRWIVTGAKRDRLRRERLHRTTAMVFRHAQKSPFVRLQCERMGPPDKGQRSPRQSSIIMVLACAERTSCSDPSWWERTRSIRARHRVYIRHYETEVQLFSSRLSVSTAYERYRSICTHYNLEWDYRLSSASIEIMTGDSQLTAKSDYDRVFAYLLQARYSTE